MADLTDIKPCPACGKRAELRAGWAFWIECECGEESDGWTNISDAIRDWNESADAAPLRHEGTCEAGERCSCGCWVTRDRRENCVYWKPAAKEPPHA